MTERERLIDICDTMTKMCRLQACGFCKYKLLKPHCVCEAIADTMLKNGVIVPPVKVGDVVYIVCNVDNKTVIEEASVEEVSTKRIWTDEVDYDLEEIGKTVFLSREEAEKALAERNGKE